MSSSTYAYLRRKRLIIAAAGTAALLAMTAIAIRPKEVAITPGTVVLDVSASAIEALIYLHEGTVMRARRSAPAGPFNIRTAVSQTHELAQCQSSPDLSGLLPQLVRVTARRQLTPKQADIEFPVKLGTLQLEDHIKAEPMPPFTVRTRSDRSAVAFVYDKTALETETSADVFVKLGAGCTALAAK